MIDGRLYTEIEQASVCHNGLLNLAMQLASYIGPFIPQGDSTFLECTLSQAIADWHANFQDGDIRVAYSAYCKAIFKALPSLLDFEISGKAVPKPHYPYKWDCISQSVTSWIHEFNINPNEIEITPASNNLKLDSRDASFLLCSHVFHRQVLDSLFHIEHQYI